VQAREIRLNPRNIYCGDCSVTLAENETKASCGIAIVNNILYHTYTNRIAHSK